MTLQEAIKSGRRFRRGNVGWHEIREGRAYIGDSAVCFGPEEVLADDWETEERTVEVTESQLEEAFEYSWKKMKDGYNSFYSIPREQFNIIKQYLGLK